MVARIAGLGAPRREPSKKSGGDSRLPRLRGPRRSAAHGFGERTKPDEFLFEARVSAVSSTRIGQYENRYSGEGGRLRARTPFAASGKEDWVERQPQERHVPRPELAHYPPDALGTRRLFVGAELGGRTSGALHSRNEPQTKLWQAQLVFRTKQLGCQSRLIEKPPKRIALRRKGVPGLCGI